MAVGSTTAPLGCSNTRALLETKRPKERVCLYLCLVRQRAITVAHILVCMGENRPRNDSGQYVTTRSSDDVLAAMEPLEPYTTGELADNLGWPRRTVYELLTTLEERGDVRKKKPEPRRAIWIRPEDTA